MNQELVQSLALPDYQERQQSISAALDKYKQETPYTEASIKAILSILHEQGLTEIDALNQCMKLCEDIATIDMTQALYLMIQLYVESMNDFVHHIWDGIELYVFENPSQSTIDYLNYLLENETDASIINIYKSWIIGLETDLQNR